MILLLLFALLTPVSARATGSAETYSYYVYPGFNPATDSFPTVVLSYLDESLGEVTRSPYSYLVRNKMATLEDQARSEGVLHATFGQSVRSIQDTLVTVLHQRTPYANLVVFYWCDTSLVAPHDRRRCVLFLRAVCLSNGVQAAMQSAALTEGMFHSLDSLHAQCLTLSRDLYQQITGQAPPPLPQRRALIAAGVAISAGIAAAVLENQVRQSAVPSRARYMAARTPDDAESARNDINHEVAHVGDLAAWRNGMFLVTAAATAAGGFFYGMDWGKRAHRPAWMFAEIRGGRGAAVGLAYHF